LYGLTRTPTEKIAQLNNLVVCDKRPTKPRYEPHFSRGLIDGGWRAPDDWFLRARLADLPALCELLTRADVPDAIVSELRDLIEMTCV